MSAVGIHDVLSHQLIVNETSDGIFDIVLNDDVLSVPGNCKSESPKSSEEMSIYRLHKVSAEKMS